MKKLILVFALAVIMSSQAYAGSANIEINCASSDSKVSLSGDVPGDFAEFHLNATIKENNGVRKLNLYSYTDQIQERPLRMPASWRSKIYPIAFLR